jgi:NADPH:quinone reductase-like Zn-dependent oxidoreductase
MRVAAFTSHEMPPRIEIREHPIPTPGPDEAVVRVEAAALNHRDLWTLRDGDRLQEDDLPFVPGGDLAGVVERTGAGVSSVEEGNSVVLCPLETCGECRFCRDGPENMCKQYASYDGAFAERALVDASRLVALPESIDAVDAAALPIAYMTALRMLKRANVTAGDRVFIPGATGGVGVAAVQLATLMGAETIGTSRSADKLRAVESVGLDHAIRGDDPDALADEVAAIGEVDATINHLGGLFTRVGLEVLRTDGAMVVCGRTAGRYPEFDARDLYFGHKRIFGSTLGTQFDLEQLVGFVEAGRLKPVVAAEYPLAETSKMIRTMEARETVGKLVVRPQE